MRLLPQVKPTPEQLRILTDNKPGYMLIRGAAGSGKTTTALMRLRQVTNFWLSRHLREEKQEPLRILVLTYNRTLEGYISELARQQVAGYSGLVLTVNTFAKWGWHLLDEPEVLSQAQEQSFLTRQLNQMGGAVQENLSFFLGEVEYALSRYPTSQLQQYLTAPRRGRGTSPRVDAALRSRILNEVIAPYATYKEKAGLIDWNDVALALCELQAPQYDIVVIDEAQDFSANQIRAVGAHLAAEFSATFVLDAMQRIYPRYFTWAEVGISSPRFMRLHKNYRNTRQIAAFARPMVEQLPVEDDGTLPDFAACDNEGQKPRVLVGEYSAQISYLITYILDNVDLTTESVVFLQPNGGNWFSYLRSALTRNGLPFCELTRQSTWPSGSEAIALCTLHSAKGLEFDYVFLPGLNQEVTPHGSDEGDTTLQTLRRLIAMGVARAKKQVIVGYKAGEASSALAFLDSATYERVDLDGARS
ncbi:3'-5' exonuclease [Parafrankia sp. FMc6]|uniref:3'-5' exonuclease n=1 Tax=Parafrankia soli TaxID=2599596 RepID=UPI0034D47E0E